MDVRIHNRKHEPIPVYNVNVKDPDEERDSGADDSHYDKQAKAIWAHAQLARPLTCLVSLG